MEGAAIECMTRLIVTHVTIAADMRVVQFVSCKIKKNIALRFLSDTLLGTVC